MRAPANRRFAASITSAALLGALLAATSAGPIQHVPTNLASSGGWLDRLNLWRTEAGQSTLTENATWSSGDYNHAVYMVKNNLVTHYETVGVPYYTTSGAAAAQDSNIFVSSSTSTTDEQAIDWWMGAPFHAMAMMDPRLTSTGFGSYRDSTTSPWQMGAALNIISGNSFTGGQFPVYFPGNQSIEPLTAYSGNETPDPTTACPGYGGLPVFIELGGNVSTAVTVHSITANATVLDTCAIDSSNATLGSYLKERGGVIVMPRSPLQTGTTYVVALTVNAVPYTWSFTVGPFRAEPASWQSLGGVLSSNPAVSSSSATKSDAFVRGSDGSMWQSTWNGVTWGGWHPLGGLLTSKPAAVSTSAVRVDVFVRGSDNQLYHTSWNGTQWSTWGGLGGILSSGPAAAFRSGTPGHVDVFARGTDNGLWHRWSDDGGNTWGNWEPLGGGLTSDPGAVSWGPTRVDVVARGTDNAVWMRSWNGASGWNSWATLGGLATSAPDVASCMSGHLDVFVRGTDNGLWQLGFNGTSWTGWKSLGGNWTSGPSAACRTGTTTIDVFAAGTDSALWTESVPAS